MRKLVDLNFFSAVFACQLAIPRMRAGGGGRIVNVSSASVRNDNEFAHMALYSSSKAAIDHFTAELRAEVKRYNPPVTLLRTGPLATSRIATCDPVVLHGERKSVVYGKSVSVGVDIGGRH